MEAQSPCETGETAPGSTAADLVSVFTLTISSVGFAISLAVLVFGGALESGMSRGIGSFVVGGGVMAIVVGSRSQIVPVATFVQESPAILMVAVAADFAAREGVGVADVFVLLVVTMVATSFATGLLGHFGLGGIGRYLPTTVVGAFVGGTGWLLLKGGLDVMTNSTLRIGDVGGLFRLHIAQFWVPGLVIGVVGWLAGRSQRVPACAVGLILCGTLAGFYGVVALGSSVAAVEQAGWLLGPFPEAGGARLVTPDEFSAANWSGIVEMAPGIASVVGMALIAQLFSLTGIRSELVPRLNVDAELRICAKANLAVALLGVTPGFQGMGYTVLLNRLGATRRAVPVVSGVLVVVFGMVGVASVGYVPRFIVGALLVMTGAVLLDGWMRTLMRSASGAERLVGIPIVSAVAWFGMLHAIGVGLVVAGAIFIVHSSQVDPVRSAGTGRQLRGSADRFPHEAPRFAQAASRVVVVELQGYLFFGSVATLEDRVRQAVRGHGVVELLVLDFANVTGVDSSGCAGIASLLQELWLGGIGVSVSAADTKVCEALVASQPELATQIAFSPGLDAALQDAEAWVLGDRV